MIRFIQDGYNGQRNCECRLGGRFFYKVHLDLNISMSIKLFSFSLKPFYESKFYKVEKKKQKEKQDNKRDVTEGMREMGKQRYVILNNNIFFQFVFYISNSSDVYIR